VDRVRGDALHARRVGLHEEPLLGEQQAHDRVHVPAVPTTRPVRAAGAPQAVGEQAAHVVAQGPALLAQRPVALEARVQAQHAEGRLSAQRMDVASPRISRCCRRRRPPRATWGP
jgi:hypothetical protein